MTAFLMFGPQHAHAGASGTPLAFLFLPILAAALWAAWHYGEHQPH